jgi:hypothetical protein
MRASAFPLPLRMVLLGAVAVVGSAYALVHHYSHPARPMYVPVLPDSGDTWVDRDAGLVPAPEIEWVR